MSAGSKGQAVGEVRKGDVVWVLSLRRQGEVLELGPKRSTVAVSGKRLKVPTDQIKPLEPREIEEMKISKAKTPPQKSLPLFIDLHGLTVDEAVVKLDPYLDEAYYQGRERVHVIHGVGTGRLRKGIHEHLKKHQLVESMELAEVEQGGAGVTIVSLKGKGDRG
jgi:DNA mismatch repair protein MutS2